MDTPQPSNLSFRLMAGMFWLRDRRRPRKHILAEVGLQPGHSVLDYGCGPGGYVLPAARMVGDQGKIYALDIHPLAVEMVQRKARRAGLRNVETIHSDCATGLPDGHIDAVLLYDILHHLSNAEAVLLELHRVLKVEGVLSVSDHHLEVEDIIARVIGSGLFQLSGRGRFTLSFSCS